MKLLLAIFSISSFANLSGGNGGLQITNSVGGLISPFLQGDITSDGANILTQGRSMVQSNASKPVHMIPLNDSEFAVTFVAPMDMAPNQIQVRPTFGSGQPSPSPTVAFTIDPNWTEIPVHAMRRTEAYALCAMAAVAGAAIST